MNSVTVGTSSDTYVAFGALKTALQRRCRGFQRRGKDELVYGQSAIFLQVYWTFAQSVLYTRKSNAFHDVSMCQMFSYYFPNNVRNKMHLVMHSCMSFRSTMTWWTNPKISKRRHTLCFAITHELLIRVWRTLKVCCMFLLVGIQHHSQRQKLE